MDQPTINMAQDLIRIHKVITRGLEVSLRSGDQYLDAGFPQPQELAGYSSYVHCLKEIISAHHTSEDQIIFPEVRKVLSTAPYEQLTSDHLKIETLLTTLPQAIADLSGDQPKKGAEIIVDTLGKISSLWYTHIGLEETNFSEAAVDRLFPKDEQKRISDAAAKHSQELAKPVYWIVPFTLFNLEPEERVKMAANIPAAVLDDLVPKVWKEQWAPMKPFLLD